MIRYLFILFILIAFSLFAIYFIQKIPGSKEAPPKEKSYITADFPQKPTISIILKDDGSPEWLDNAKESISNSVIKSDIDALLIANLMTKVNKRENLYTLDKIKSKIREGIVIQIALIKDTMEDKPIRVVEYLRGTENKKTYEFLVKESRKETGEMWDMFLRLYDTGKYLELVDYVASAKEFATNSKNSFEDRMSRIVFATFITPPKMFVMMVDP